MGLLSRGNSFLARAVGTKNGVTVTYTRGATSVAVTDAVPGNSFAAAVQPQQVPARVEVQDRDYLIPAAAIAALGEPAVGDRIAEPGVGTFEVVRRAGEPAWRWSDAERTLYRIRTKPVG